MCWREGVRGFVGTLASMRWWLCKAVGVNAFVVV